MGLRSPGPPAHPHHGSCSPHCARDVREQLRQRLASQVGRAFGGGCTSAAAADPATLPVAAGYPARARVSAAEAIRTARQLTIPRPAEASGIYRGQSHDSALERRACPAPDMGMPAVLSAPRLRDRVKLSAQMRCSSSLSQLRMQAYDECILRAL